MILVDTSVWIDFFSTRSSPAARELRRLIAEAEPFALAGIVVAEILQGLTRHVQEIERYLAMWDLLEPNGFSTYRDAASIFRLARSKGISLSTTDSLIAAIAVDHGAAVFTLDKDFRRIAQLVDLTLYSPGP